MEVFAGDCESRMGRVAGPMVALLFVFARKVGAGTGRRPAWGVLSPLAVRICSLTKQPFASGVSRDRGAVSGWTSVVGGR